jgi:hypothetical protein
MDCVNFFIFLIWFLNFFFPNNLVLIKNQLILISYEMVELKKMDQNKKKKKWSNIGGVLYVSQKIHFDHLTLKITQII